MVRDELVQSVSCYNSRPLLLHGYIGPFLTIYAIIVYSWLTLPVSEIADQKEINATEPNFNLLNLNSTDNSSDVKDAQNSTSEAEDTYRGPSLNDTELWVIAVVSVAVVQIVTYLFCHWSVHVRCFLAFSKVRIIFNLL